MDTSLITYLTETAAELTRKSETVFPSMAQDLLMEAEELAALATKMLTRSVELRSAMVEFKKAA